MKFSTAIATLTMLASSVISVSGRAANNNESPSTIKTTPFYYTPYDYYDTISLASTNHYIAAIAPSSTTFNSSFFNVYFYLNNTIVSSNPTNSNLFSFGTGFSLITASMTDYSTSVKSLSTTVIKSGTPPLPSMVLKYHLDGVENNTFVNTEYDLLRRTSQSYYSPSTLVPTSLGDSFVKIVYALGDVDRNGVINSDDSSEIQKYLLSLAEPLPGRTTDETAYDEMAFKLAADFNKNGTVDMGDVNSIDSYISSH